jgi:hypothetical protein
MDVDRTGTREPTDVECLDLEALSVGARNGYSP